MGEVLYDIPGMQACLDELNHSINNVTTVHSDLTQIVNGIEASIKTVAVSSAMTAVYRQMLQVIETDVLDQLNGQHKYVQECLEHAIHADTSMAGGWG